jgi:adhesin transport system outer membrane protein
LSGQIASGDDSSQATNVRVRQPLWAFGRIDSNIAFADADKVAEEADLILVKRQLLDQTAVAYARVQGAQQRLDIAVENVAELDILHQRIQRRERGQMASVADVRLALTRLMQARARQERFNGELVVAETDLRTLTQIAVQVEQSVPSELTHLPGDAELEELALAQSGEILLKTQQVALARADARREKVSIMPTVYLQADHSSIEQSARAADDDDTVVGVVLEGSLDGMGFAALGRGKAATARLQAAMEDLKATRNEISRTVKSLATNRKLQQDLIDIQRQSIEELREILASYQRQYEAGHKTWLDVLNLQREWNEQSLQQAQAENDWLIYTLKLAALTGGLDALAGENKE